jgi:hypothetical protein
MKKKLIITLSVIAALIASCSVRSSEAERRAVTKALQGSTSESLEKQMNVNDLSGCPILIEQGEWKTDKFGTGRSQTWLDEMLTSTGISLDHTEFKSYKVGEMADKNKKHSHKDSRLIYVGPWKYVEKLGKQIRLVSMQDNRPEKTSGRVINFYESLDPQNQKIPAMPLKLIKPAYGNEFCILKWHIKYGYNGIAETYRQLRPGFWNWLFRNHELVVTGKIIEAKE